MVLKALATRQCRIVILGKWNTNEVSPIVAPAYFLDKVSGLAYRRGSPGGVQ